MRGLRDLGLVAQSPDALPHRPEHQQSVASLACNVSPHAAVASLACKVSPFTTAKKQSLLRSLPCEARSSLRALACSSPAWANTWPFLLMHYDRPVLLTLAFSRSLVSFISSYLFLSLSMPPLCLGQVGHPRLQPLGLLLLCRQGRSQVCDDSL